MTTVPPAATYPPAAAPVSIDGTRALIGTILVRIVVPVWLLAGALFKVVELNPNVLPGPVKDIVLNAGSALNVSDLGLWLVGWMRAMIGVELALVGIMFFVPKLARAAAIAILSLFCVILVFELIPVFQSKAFAKEGMAVLLKPCGCFGAWSPPTVVTFLIDLVMLVGCIVCRPGAAGRRIPGPQLANIALVGSVILGAVVAYARPAKIIAGAPIEEAAGAGSGEAAQPTTQPSTQPTTPQATPPSTPQATPSATLSVGQPTNEGSTQAGAQQPWPAMPAKLAPTYVFLDKRAIGKQITELPFAALFADQKPDAIRTGRTHMVFYRATCDHCFEMMNKHFAGALATPTFSVEVPDSTGGKRYPNACANCVKLTLPKGPDYMIPTPLVLTLVDGKIVAICKDSDKPGALEATLNAWAPGHESMTAVDGMLLAPFEAKAAPTPTAAAPTPPAQAAKPWPAMPELKAFYAPDFDTWKGKRLDELDLMLIVKRPLPFDPNEGLKAFVFYRVDCEHCHVLFADHFAGTLPMKTMAVAIPDTSGEPLDMACVECALGSLVEGPTYVLETPILVVAKDGVVQSVLVGKQNDDPALVDAALGKSAK
jgi:hypothetical protein